MNRYRHLLLNSVCGVTLLALVGCESTLPPQADSQVPQIPEKRNSFPVDHEGSVVKARAKLNLIMGADGNGKGEILAAYLDEGTDLSPPAPEVEIFSGQSGSTDVSVTLPVSTAYGLDLTSFVSAPPISNQMVSFGNIGVANSFYDNNIKVCGAGQNGMCTQASIRAYTSPATGVTNAGDGLWNADGGYGVPLFIKDTSGVSQQILLGQANSKLLQSFLIPGSKRVLTYSDWQTLGGVVPSYAVSADFTLAGAGVYQATLVLEYVLGQ